MQVKIDAALCSGHGRCAVLAPTVYKLDDNGYNADRGKTLDIPAEQAGAARKGAKLCPERAITLIEGENLTHEGGEIHES
jgi:ferredoxin